MRVLHLDIETYSSAPLPKCGVYRYCGSPDFEILLLSYAFDDGPVVTADLACGEQIPDEFLHALEDTNVLKIAHHALFDRVCLSKHLGHQLGAYWQGRGLTVIPSVCWSDEASYDWCFDGEPAGGTVAVSSVGTQKNPKARQLFLAGYQEMTARLKPAKVIFFGDVPEGCTGNIERHSAYHAALPHARRR